MAQPSSSHHGERHRSDRSSHHHHRTISSTTLLLVLSLILAVLAVMLSLPNNQSASIAQDPSASGILSYLSPKRSQQLISREGEVARREAEVARREAELLVGSPAGIAACPPCQAATTIETIQAPVQTVIKEVVKEDSLAPPGWSNHRVEEILDRELKIAEREREISKREENVNRREHDASRRESWIMEQLIALGNDNPQTVEDEYIYEPSGAKRKAKYQELPPIPSEPTVTVTQTISVPAPAKIRGVASPAPEVPVNSASNDPPRTTAVEIVLEEEEEPPRVARRARRPPSRWFGGW